MPDADDRPPADTISAAHPLPLPPAQPKYVLRGHSAHVHAVRFLRDNTRLLTGDADGWVVLWNLTTKRAVAVWRPHDGPILALRQWGPDKIITHGRDSSLKVWQLRPEDESNFSKVLPLDDASSHRTQPWLLHSLMVNTLNFCPLDFCPERKDSSAKEEQPTPPRPTDGEAKDDSESILVAVPSTHDNQADVFQLPSEQRLHTVPAIQGTDTGMIMALRIFYAPNDSSSSSSSNPPPLLLIAGYESGHTAIHQHSPQTNSWHTTYLSHPHTQPILSLAVSPLPSQHPYYYTSSADAILAQHSLHPHQEANGPPSTPPSSPLKTVNTKHPAQQSLTVRSDGRLLATAGWDGRVRVYAARALRERAVLKWHKEGVYAVDFAAVSSGEKEEEEEEEEEEDGPGGDGGGGGGGGGEEGGGEGESRQALEKVVGRRRELFVSERRAKRARETHWLAAGAKDGKVSLWDVF